MESQKHESSHGAAILNNKDLPIWLQAGITIFIFAGGIILYYAM